MSQDGAHVLFSPTHTHTHTHFSLFVCSNGHRDHLPRDVHVHFSAGGQSDQYWLTTVLPTASPSRFRSTTRRWFHHTRVLIRRLAGSQHRRTALSNAVTGRVERPPGIDVFRITARGLLLTRAFFLLETLAAINFRHGGLSGSIGPNVGAKFPTNSAGGLYFSGFR